MSRINGGEVESFSRIKDDIECRKKVKSGMKVAMLLGSWLILRVFSLSV